MAVGNIGTVIDTLEFDPTWCKNPQIIHISGNVCAIAYAQNYDGWLVTVDIGTDGTIGSVLDTLEFADDNGAPGYGCCPYIIHISGDVYAIAYQGHPGGSGPSEGYLCTVSIDSSGNIGAAVIDSTKYSASTTLAGGYPTVINVSGGIYAISHIREDDLRVTTLEVASNGIIGAVIDDADIHVGDLLSPSPTSIIHISGSVYAIPYRGPWNGTNYTGWLKTFSIDSNGLIGSVIDSLEFETSNCNSPKALHISATTYAIVHQGADADGWLKTISIADNGTIGAIISTLEFDTTVCTSPRIIYVAGTAYAIAYTGVDSDGFLKTVQIADDGTIGSVLDTLEFDSVNGGTPNIISLSNSVYAIAYQGPDSDGWLCTVGIEIEVVAPSVTTDAATLIEQTAATLNGTLDDDGREICNCGFEYGETIAYGTATPTENKNTGEVFSQVISGLLPRTLYHLRAIATNSVGTSYGADETFTALGFYQVGIEGLRLPYVDLNGTKELHVVLENLSPIPKEARADGELVIEVEYQLEA